mgnify:CR=1 FL=1
MNNIFLNVIAYWLRGNTKAIVMSLFSVIVISLLSYMLNNQTLFTGEDLPRFGLMEFVKHKVQHTKPMVEDNAVFVNVAYDKTLITAYEGDPDTIDEYSMPKGQIDITDRSKLLEFLQILQRTNTYAYIFLDIRFEAQYKVPEVDSLLFAQIAKMRNIVVALHTDMEKTAPQIADKLAYNDYPTTLFSSNFIRYKYLYADRPSMALRAYRELTGKDIARHSFWYSCDERLCYNSLFIDFPKEEASVDKVKLLGVDMLEDSKGNIAKMTKGKYVVIGDMTNDVHVTYCGEKAGPVITYNAFLALMSGKHIVSLWVSLLMAVIYFLISMAQFKGWSMIPLSKGRPRSLVFICSLFEYTMLLTIVVVVMSLCWNVYLSVIVPSLYFTIQKMIVKYKN